MAGIKMIFVDSNIFIFANIAEYPEYSIAKERIKELIVEHEIGVNSIIMSEVSGLNIIPLR